MAIPPSSADHMLSALPMKLFCELFAKGRTVSLKAGQSLFVSGDRSNGCYRLDEGLLKVSITTARGGERILAILGPGAIVGELSMLDGSPRSASAKALRASKLCFISSATFEAFADDHPEVYRQGMMLLARRLRATNDALIAATFKSLRGRVARVLLSLAEVFGNDVGDGRILIQQKITQSDLAAMAGISRANVSRILAHWMRSAMVSRLAGYYCLENRAAIDRELDAFLEAKAHRAEIFAHEQSPDRRQRSARPRVDDR
jgi:CRP/FNR family transcriptional regulator, cyclic AMP receptor protein